MRIIFLIFILFFTNVQAEQHRSQKDKVIFKYSLPSPSTGRNKGSCPDYIIDHIKPLACGGLDDASNMQWQTKAQAIDMYKDSLSLWQMQFDSAGNPNLTLKEGYLQLEFYNVSPLINKYDLPIHSLDIFNLNKGINAQQSIQIIWDKAFKVIGNIKPL